MTSQIGWPGVLGEWTLTPVSDALVLLAAVAYLNAARRRRGWHGARWPPWRTVCTLSGLAVIVLALGHPLTLALESSTHGREIVELVRHNRVVAIVTHPLVAFASYAAVIVGTHLTGFMALTFVHPWLHELELALYLLSGYLFAAPLVAREPLRLRPPYPARFGLVLLSMTVHTFVGIMLMTTGDSADLRLAGGLMWFVGDGLMMAVALVIAGHWVTDPNRSLGETARTLHHRVLAALTRPRPPHRPKDEGDP